MAQSLSNLPIGAKVKFGKHSVNGETAQPITWVVVAKNHAGYPSNSVTLLTEKIIDIRAYDAKEPNNSDKNIAEYGNNGYSASNIDQWLNSSQASWYTPTHSADQAPSSNYVTYGTSYDSRPGFLSNFTSSERLAILSTPLVVTKYWSTTETLSRGVFLPSAAEIGIGISITDGSPWGYFSNPFSRMCTLTAQCQSNTLSTEKPSSEPFYWYWLFRSADFTSTYRVVGINKIGDLNYLEACCGNQGIRPAVNISGTQKISDVTDSDGCYVPIYNSAPPAPTTIAIPTSVYGGKTNAISWSGVTDPDGNSVTYQLECSINGGGYTQIYSGAALSYAHLVPFGTNTVTYRVKATDTASASSAYTTSATRTVVNNNAPVISGTDANLGVKSSGFTGKYTVTDVNGNAVTVTEAIDGVQIRALVATLDTEITYSVTGNTWLALSNGSHTLTITATDGLDTTVRTYTFSKSVNTLKIQNATPWAATTKPSRIMLVVTRNVPYPATFKVEVCNNGYDSSPTWEDATATVLSGLVHVFANTTKTATNWGVRVRVTVARNGATGACYVSAIGGNFE